MSRAEQDRIRQRKGEGNKRIAQAARKMIELRRAKDIGAAMLAMRDLDDTIRDVDSAGQHKGTIQ